MCAVRIYTSEPVTNNTLQFVDIRIGNGLTGYAYDLSDLVVTTSGMDPAHNYTACFDGEGARAELRLRL